MIPAVLYGHGAEPRHLTFPGHETMLLIRQANAVVELVIDGKVDEVALVKDVQRDPVRRINEHVDLILVKKGERVEVDVPVHVEGEPASGMQAIQDATTLLVSAEAMHIPEQIVVSVEGLEEGAVVHATDVQLPKGAKLVDEEPAEGEAAEESAEGGEDAPAEGEGE